MMTLRQFVQATNHLDDNTVIDCDRFGITISGIVVDGGGAITLTLDIQEDKGDDFSDDDFSDDDIIGISRDWEPSDDDGDFDDDFSGDIHSSDYVF